MKRIKLYNKINGNIICLNPQNVIQLALDQQEQEGGITIALDFQKTITLSNQEWSTCNPGSLSERIKHIINTNQPVTISNTWYSGKSIRSIVSRYNSARLKQGLSTLAIMTDEETGLITIAPQAPSRK